jgi:histidine kinase/DNA gyrase B/HSP90-like ATPase
MELEPTVDEAADAYRNDARRKGIDYTVKFFPGLPKKVMGDQRKVRQAISNVIANAIKHTSKGSVTVEVYAASVESNVTNVDVVVQDTGAGMSAKQLDALFMHLEQVQTDSLMSPEGSEIMKSGESSAKSEDPSLGLGLAVVARIVRNMNGQLRLKSEEGRGSRFIIQFPFELPKEELSKQGTASPKSTVKTPLVGQEQNEVLLVNRDRESARSRAQSPNTLVRSGSNDSLRSKKSLKSMAGSVGSATSARSDVDRLIEAIQGPHLVESKRRSGPNILEGVSASRPMLEKMRTLTDDPTTAQRLRAKSYDNTGAGGPVSLETIIPGQQSVPFSGTPIKPVKVPDEPGVPIPLKFNTPGKVTGEVLEENRTLEPAQNLTAERFNILVAEDDPVNSKIVKKRLERSGHEVFLTVNGEECASAYAEKEQCFDVVLMDMQANNSKPVPLTLKFH